MLFLVISILTSSSIYLIFKWFDILRVRVFEAIVVNYIVAATIGLLNIEDFQAAVNGALEWPTWSIAGVVLGGIFISVFYLMALTASRVGVSVTTIASKMSLAIGFVLFALLAGTAVSSIQWIAIILALAGVVFSSLKDDLAHFNLKYLFWPLLILIGSTAIDFGLAYFSSGPSNIHEETLFSCMPFCIAAIIGIVVVIKNFITKKEKLRLKDILAGLFLGSINYFSIYCLVRAYTSGLFPENTLLAINNLSIVVLSALAAIVFYKEKMRALNWIGLAFAAIALVLLMI